MIIFYMVILGMAMISVLPASIGLGVEITFPMQPALVSGVMMMFAQISGCLQSVVYSAIMDVDANDYPTEQELNDVRHRRIIDTVLISFLFLLITLLGVFCVKEDLKRLRYN